MVNYLDAMPNLNTEAVSDRTPNTMLDRTFGALVDPTRRAILARLSEQGDLSVSELARPFAIKLPAVMKHLDVLVGAGLVLKRKEGRTVTVRLVAEPMAQAIDWLERYRRFWTPRIERLAEVAEEKERQEKEKRG